MKLAIGGFVPFTATDYPGHLAAVVFCQGCPWRCSYCHNPHLLPRDTEAEVAWTRIIAFLKRRTRLLDAVVFSGGEPTLHAGLAAAMREVKALGFKVGLHTAGIYPRRLAPVLPLVDWVGFDIKAPFDRYARVTGTASSGARAQQSLALLLASGVAHELRTTFDRRLLGDDDIERIRATLPAGGAKRYVLQACRA